MKLNATLITAAVLSASAGHAAPVQWEASAGGNGHWYDFVIADTPQTIVDTEAAVEAASFMGLGGYLATITSQEEQTFLNGLWPGAGSVSGQFNDLSYFLIGGSDRDQEGAFEWIGGPEDGQAFSYTNWSSGEPNNTAASGMTEQYVFAWWLDSAAGVWNDGGDDTSVSQAYVVEYSEALVSTVPVPAALPLMVFGMGALGALRRRARNG